MTVDNQFQMDAPTCAILTVVGFGYRNLMSEDLGRKGPQSAVKGVQTGTSNERLQEVSWGREGTEARGPS